jgi:type I restriction enzyme, S subunit
MGFESADYGELPVLPTGWKVAPLGSALALIVDYRGKTPPKSPFGIPCLTAANVKNGRIYLEGVSYISSSIYAQVTTRGLPLPGDVLLTTEAPVAEVAEFPADRTYHITRRLVALRPDAAKLSNRYLLYALQGGPTRRLLRSRIRGSTVERILKEDITKLPIPLPPLAEQEQIAHILGTLDDKIELNRRMNETLEAMARALFKSWFVDFDPVRAKAQGQTPPGLDPATAALFPSEFEGSELGKIPKGWTSLGLYDAATYVNGAAYRAFQPNGDRRGLPIIKIAELKAGVTSQTKFSDVQMPEKYRLKTGDILFSWSGNPDTSIDTFVWSHGPAWLNQHIFRVDPHRPEERTFVLATLKYLRPVFAELARNKQTTGLGHVTAGDMKRLLIVKPDERILKAWNAAANRLFDAVFRNTLEAYTLAKARDALLPRLLSGELSVADVIHVEGTA